MSRKPALLLAAFAAALTLGACAAPTAPRQLTPGSARHDDPPPDTTKRCGGGLIGSGTYTC